MNTSLLLNLRDAITPFTLPVGMLLPDTSPAPARQQLSPAEIREFESDVREDLEFLAVPRSLDDFVTALAAQGSGRADVPAFVDSELLVVLGQGVARDLPALQRLALYPLAALVGRPSAAVAEARLPDGRLIYLSAVTVAVLAAGEEGQSVAWALRNVIRAGGEPQRTIEAFYPDLVALLTHGGAYLGLA